MHGASEAVFRKFSATELYLKRARKTVAKMMRLQWTQDLDIETLEARMEEGNNGGVVGGRKIPSAALRKYREDLQIEPSSSEPLRLDICHEICSHVSVHQSEGVASHDLSIFDGGHDCYS